MAAVWTAGLIPTLEPWRRGRRKPSKNHGACEQEHPAIKASFASNYKDSNLCFHPDWAILKKHFLSEIVSQGQLWF